MKKSPEVAPTEDAVQALLDHLVDPMLPATSSIRDTPSLDQQQSVAKQVHAVVLLYNYYHRKCHPQLEFLDFESFCKLAVVLKPSLVVYLKLMQTSDDTEFDELEKHLSVTEKMIMDACDISSSLDPSKDFPTIESWPISKVTVFLVDSRKENCFLLFSSLTQGVWSVIEKDLDDTNSSSSEAKHMNKKKRPNRRPLKDEPALDEASFRQPAFLAVKEATGITQTDLVVLESHVVYSLSKEKTADRFYIMQCTQSANENIQVPIKDVIDSLQGPVVQKSAKNWIATQVVEYFHVLPYAGILLDWFSRIDSSSEKREVSSYGLQDSKACFENVTTGNLGDSELNENGNISHKNAVETEVVCEKTSVAKPTVEKEKETNLSSMVGFSDAFDRRYKMNVDVASRVSTKKEDKSAKVSKPVQVYHYQKKANSSAVSGLNASSTRVKVVAAIVDSVMKPCITEKVDSRNGTSNNISSDKTQGETVDSLTKPCIVEKVDTSNKISNAIISYKDAEMVESAMKLCTTEKVDSGNKISNSSSPDQDIGSEGAMVTFQPNSKPIDKPLVIMSSKANALAQTALRLLLRKRDELSRQERILQDEISQCEKNIQTILSGGEDNLAEKIDAIIAGCNDIGSSSIQTRDRAYDHIEDQVSLQYIKRKRLSDAILTLQPPCQELDGICNENNWNLPTYRLSSSDGGFQAEVTLRGMDFEYTSIGELRGSPRDARDSAAANVLAKLRNMATQSLQS